MTRIFVIQNIHSIGEFMRERLDSGSFQEIQGFLFRDFVARDVMRTGGAASFGPIHLAYEFTRPSFRIHPELESRRIIMSLQVNGTAEEAEFGFSEFFDAVIASYGDEPLTRIDEAERRQ